MDLAGPQQEIASSGNHHRGKLIQGNAKAVPKTKRRPVVVYSEVITSRAWLSLTGIAPQVYALFLLRRRMEKQGRRGHEKWVCTNNGEIIFTYREAETRHQITPPRFLRAIDNLVKLGFIDITSPGKAVAKVPTKYAISERWRDYGKESFEKASRKKVKMGFCRTRTEAPE
jgi:hypothetical protein